MNIVSDPKSIPASSLLSPEANQAAALATATGVLTVDLDAIVANWRKLEKTAVPAECAGVIKADAYGCGTEPVARALAAAGCKTFFVATLDEARAARAAVPSATIYVLDGFFQNTGDAYAKIDARPVIGDLNELAEWDVFCRRSGWAGGAAIHIDTGMNRLGLTIDGGAGHHSPDQCRRSRHHAGDEPPRLRRKPQSSAQRQAARGLPRDRQPVFRRAGIAVEFVRHFPRRASSSSTWCGRAQRSTASIRRRRPTIRCSRWSS